jgi:hypothetical protein
MRDVIPLWLMNKTYLSVVSFAAMGDSETMTGSRGAVRMKIKSILNHFPIQELEMIKIIYLKISKGK